MSEVMKSYSTKEKGMTTTRHGSRGALTFLTVPLVLLVACMLGPSAARAQWTTSGNNISNTNTGNVGVGTASPEESLHVLGNVRVGFAPTTLTKVNAAGGINATDTTLTVVSTASYPSSGTLLLDREAITYTGKTATTFTGLTRGMFGTTAVAHADQTEVDTYLLNVQVQSSARPKFVVTGKGYVGIGRHAPTASLHIAHSGDMAPIAYDANTNAQGLLFNQYTVIADGYRRYSDIAALGVQDGTSGGSTIRFITNPINTPTAFERMRIDRDGNVGVGTAAPAHKLEVAGSSSRNTMALTGDGDAVGYAGLRIQAQTTTNIPTNRTAGFVLSMRKDAWYGGDGSGPSFIIETTSKTGGFAAPFLITPNNNVILNGGQGASGLSYGNVGVGTVNPAHKLDVAGNVNASGLCLGGTCKTTWSEISGTPSQWTTGGSNIYFGGGNVGIGPGMTGPGEALMVNGKVSINRVATPGPAEFRIFNGGMVAEWSFRQASAASHNLNISKSASGVYTDYMTIDTAGNVGVGTNAPASKLHVGGGTPAGGALAGLNVALGGNSYVSTSNGTVNTFIGSDISAYGIVGTYTNHPLGLRANNALAMTLMPSGNVGVGTAAPAHKLDVAGNVNASGLCLGGTCKTSWSEISGSGSQWTTSGSNISFSTGNVGVGTNTPGARLDVGAGAAARGAYTDLLIGAGGNNAQLEFYGPTKSTAIAHDEALGGLAFHMNGPAFSPSFFVGNTGNVGVGTTAPAHKLHVFGGNVLQQFSATAGQEYGFYTSIRNNHVTSNVYFDGQWKMMTAGKGAFISTAPLDGVAFMVYADNTSRAANAPASFTQLMAVTMDGNVGVGNTAPAHKLDVAGNVNASGLCLGGTCKTSWSEISGSGSQWAASGSNISFNSGNVGVGTNTPTRKLEVQAADGDAARFYRDANFAGWGVNVSFALNNSNNVKADYAGMSGVINNAAAGAEGGSLVFFTATSGSLTEKMRVNSAGNVGIGTAAPAHKLDVAGNVNASGLCLGGTCKSTWSEISGSGGQWTNSGSNIHFGGGNVGIGSGAANPAELLELNGPGEVKARAAGTISAAVQLRESNGTTTWSEWQQYYDRLRLNTHDGAATRADVMSVLPDGRVGVGTAAPLTKLHVAGDITVDGNITAKYQDVAEWVPSVQRLRAGTVVVLDAGRNNHVVASGSAYDTKVAGVVSETPGLILGVAGDDKVKVATTGRVRVRVDASRGGILVGDLLVTSEVEGVAMKSIPVDLGGTPIHRPGTIIGKALEPLKGGVGEILVLLSLQ